MLSSFCLSNPNVMLNVTAWIRTRSAIVKATYDAVILFLSGIRSSVFISLFFVRRKILIIEMRVPPGSKLP